MTQVFLLFDPDPRIKFSKEAYELTGYLEKKVKGKVLVGGSQLPVDQLKYVEKRIEEIRKYTDATICIFPGDEDQVSDKGDELLVPCLYNALDKRDFDERQITFEVNYGKKLRKIWGEDKIEYAFYPVLNPNASAFKGRCRDISPVEVVDAMNWWYHGGETSFDRFYLEGGSGQLMAPLSLIKDCFDIFSEEDKELFIYGGGIISVEKAKAVKNIGVRNMVFGNINQNNPEEMKKILEEVLM